MKAYKAFLSAMAVVLFTGVQAFGISLGDSGIAVNADSIYSDGSHGEYLFSATSGPVNNSSYSTLTKNITQAGSFQTFCLEVYRLVATVPSLYKVDDEARTGGDNLHGPAGNLGGDILSVGTAWLYSQFASGVLAGYDYTGSTASRTADAQSCNARSGIWRMNDAHPGNFYLGLAEAQFGGSAAARANYSAGQYGVYVVGMFELVGSTYYDRQDMLFYSVTSTPDGGATVVLLGMALFGVSALRRYAVAA